MKKVALKYLFFAVFAVSAAFTSCKKDNQEDKSTEINVTSVPFELGTLNKVLEGRAVTAIAFDSKGNAWIGTYEQGIIKYDAEENDFFVYDYSIFHEDFVTNDIAIDKNDNVWIGVSRGGGMGNYNGGLFKYDGQEFTFYNSQNTPMPIDYVRAIEVDSQNNIWFTSCNIFEGGLVKYDGAEWTIYTPDNSVLPYNLINSIVVDQSDNVWVAYYNCLVKISNNKFEIISEKELGFTIPWHIGDIKINSKNQVVGTIDYFSYPFDESPPPHDPTRIVMFTFDGNKTTLLTWEYFIYGIPCIYIDRKANVWCYGTAGSYFVFPYYGVWFGSEIGGTFRYSDFLPYKYLTAVTDITEAPDDKIWFGSFDGIYIR